METVASPFFVARVWRKNAFDPLRECDRVEWRADSFARDYIPEGLRGANVRIIHNGVACPDNPRIEPGDSLAFIVIPEGPELTIAQHVFMSKSGGTGRALSGGIIAGMSAFFPGAAPFLIPLGIGIAAGAYGEALTSAFAPNTKTNKKNTAENYAASPTYNLDGFQNTSINGLPIAVIYGKNRVAGQIVNQFYKVNEQGKSTLFALIALGHGPINSICGFTTDRDSITGSDLPSTLEFNGSPVTSFGSAVRMSVRLGTFNQDPMPQFNNVTTTQTVGSALNYNSAISYTTTAPVSAFDVNISHPSGLYKINATSGATQAYSVTYQIRWREAGGNGWFDTKTKTVTATNKAEFSSAFHVDAPLGKNADGSAVEKILEIEVTRTTAADNNFQQSTITWASVNEIVGGDLAYPGIALVGVEALSTDQLAGGIQVITALVEGKKVPVWDGVSTSAPVFNLKYDDGVPTKEDTDETASVWQALNANAGTNDNAGFKFHTLQTRTITAVKARMRRASATAIISGGVYCEIQTDSNGIPSGTAVATSETRSVAKLKYNTGETWSFAFSSPVALTAGAQYHAVFKSTYSTSATNHVQIGLVPDASTFDFELKGGASWGSQNYRVVAETVFRGRRPGENPAWWAVDFLVNSQYGLGPWVAVADIAPYLSQYLAWANYNDECYETYRSSVKSLPGPRWAGGYVMDIEASGWEQALKLASVGNATLVPIGNAIKPIVNKPETYSQLFVESNLTDFKTAMLGTKDRPNRFEVQFANEDIGYNKDIAVAEDPIIQTSGESIRVSSSNVFGLTASWRAMTAAKQSERSAKLIRRSIQFTAPMDAVNVEAGDIIKVAHPLRTVETFATTSGSNVDVFGGKVVAATSTTLSIDRSTATPVAFPWAAKVIVRTTSAGVESIQERDITVFGTFTTNTGQTYTKFTVDPAWTTTPSAGDIFSYLGNGTTDAKQYRVLGVGMAEQMRVAVSAVEYTTNLYDTDYGADEEFTDTLPIPERVPDAVENLTLSVAHDDDCAGGTRSAIEVFFSKPRGDVWAEIHYRVSGDEAWTYAGRTQGESYKIPDVVCDTTYDVAVVAASATQARGSLESAPNDTIYVVAPWAKPAAPSALTASQLEHNILLQWTASGTPTLAVNGNYSAGVGSVKCYEARRGLSWAVGEYLGESVGTSLIIPGISYGLTQTYWVAAKSRAGIYSDPISVAVTAAQDFLTEIAAAELSPGFTGTKTNCSVAGAGALAGEGGILQASDSSASFVPSAIDTGAIRLYKLFVEPGYVPNDGGELTIDEATFTYDSEQATRRFMNGWNETPIDPGPMVLDDTTDTVDSWLANYMTYGGPISQDDKTTAKVEYCWSDDNVTYTDYIPLVNGAGFVYSRYIKFKVTMTGDAAGTVGAQRVALQSLKYRIVRWRALEAGSVATSTGGTVTVTLANTYSTGVFPTVGVRLASGGDSCRISNTTTTSFDVDVFNSAGSRVARTVYWNLIV